MKYLILFCCIGMGCLFPLQGMAQPKCFIVPHEIYLDRAGKQFAFKVTYQDVVDTIYFVDIASGMITDRVAEGTFGLELKMLKAKVLNWEEEMQPNLEASISAWGRGKWEKYNRYEIRSKSSMLASAWLPYTFTQHSSDLRCIFKSSPPTVLLYGRLDGKRALYNMLDTSSNGMAKQLYLDKDNQFSNSYRWKAHISPDGRYVLAATEGAMIDLAEGSVIWKYPFEHVEGDFYASFSEDGTRVAIERAKYSVSVRDMKRGKEQHRISAPPSYLTNLAGQDCIIPLPDMQHAILYDHNPISGRVNLLLIHADGTYKEWRF